MFIVSKGLLISTATVIIPAGGAIWLNPFATILFGVCNQAPAMVTRLPFVRHNNSSLWTYTSYHTTFNSTTKIH